MVLNDLDRRNDHRRALFLRQLSFLCIFVITNCDRSLHQLLGMADSARAHAVLAIVVIHLPVYCVVTRAAKAVKKLVFVLYICTAHNGSHKYESVS